MLFQNSMGDITMIYYSAAAAVLFQQFRRDFVGVMIMQDSVNARDVFYGRKYEAHIMGHKHYGHFAVQFY